MNWELAIKINREALIRIVATLFAMLDVKSVAMSAELRAALLHVLRPAESAARRLIFILAYRMSAKIPPNSTLRAAPDFSSFGQSAKTNAPRFKLYDSPKRFDFGDKPKYSKFQPHVFVFDGRQPSFAPTATTPPALPNGKSIIKRIHALQSALNDLPKQAKRMALAMEKQKTLPAGPRKMPPLRPGFPPGYRRRHIHEIDAILKECQGLAQDIKNGIP